MEVCESCQRQFQDLSLGLDYCPCPVFFRGKVFCSGGLLCSQCRRVHKMLRTVVRAVVNPPLRVKPPMSADDFRCVCAWASVFRRHVGEVGMHRGLGQIRQGKNIWQILASMPIGPRLVGEFVTKLYGRLGQSEHDARVVSVLGQIRRIQRS